MTQEALKEITFAFVITGIPMAMATLIVGIGAATEGVAHRGEVLYGFPAFLLITGITSAVWIGGVTVALVTMALVDWLDL